MRVTRIGLIEGQTNVLSIYVENFIDKKRNQYILQVSDLANLEYSQLLNNDLDQVYFKNSTTVSYIVSLFLINVFMFCLQDRSLQKGIVLHHGRQQYGPQPFVAADRRSIAIFVHVRPETRSIRWDFN